MANQVTQPTIPQSLTAVGTIGSFQLEPQQNSAIVVVSGSYTGVTIAIEASRDKGVLDPWGPVPALRESKLTLDSFEGSAGMTLADGQTYKWRIDGLTKSAYLRIRVITITGGTFTVNRMESGAFFLESPPTVTLSLGSEITLRLMLLELMRARIALAEISNHDLVAEVVMADVVTAIATA